MSNEKIFENREKIERKILKNLARYGTLDAGRRVGRAFNAGAAAPYRFSAANYLRIAAGSVENDHTTYRQDPRWFTQTALDEKGYALVLGAQPVEIEYWKSIDSAQGEYEGTLLPVYNAQDVYELQQDRLLLPSVEECFSIAKDFLAENKLPLPDAEKLSEAEQMQAAFQTVKEACIQQGAGEIPAAFTTELWAKTYGLPIDYENHPLLGSEDIQWLRSHPGEIFKAALEAKQRYTQFQQPPQRGVLLLNTQEAIGRMKEYFHKEDPAVSVQTLDDVYAYQYTKFKEANEEYPENKATQWFKSMGLPLEQLNLKGSLDKRLHTNLRLPGGQPKLDPLPGGPFEDLEVIFHWTEGRLRDKEGTPYINDADIRLRGERAYEFLANLNAMDKELAPNMGYQKTSLTVRYKKINFKDRADLGDPAFGDAKSVAAALEKWINAGNQYYLKHPDILQKDTGAKAAGFAAMMEKIQKESAEIQGTLGELQQEENRYLAKHPEWKAINEKEIQYPYLYAVKTMALPLIPESYIGKILPEKPNETIHAIQGSGSAGFFLRNNGEMPSNFKGYAKDPEDVVYFYSTMNSGCMIYDQRNNKRLYDSLYVCIPQHELDSCKEFNRDFSFKYKLENPQIPEEIPPNRKNGFYSFEAMAHLVCRDIEQTMETVRSQIRIYQPNSTYTVEATYKGAAIFPQSTYTLGNNDYIRTWKEELKKGSPAFTECMEKANIFLKYTPEDPAFECLLDPPFNTDVRLPSREESYANEEERYKKEIQKGALTNDKNNQCNHYKRLALVDPANNTREKVERAMVQEMLLDGIISTQTIKSILKTDLRAGFDYNRITTILKEPKVKSLRETAKKLAKGGR